MTVRIVAFLALLLLVPLSISAQAPARPDRGQIFKDADRNRDGRLDREEFHRVIVEAFYFRDKDKNGYLVITEVSEIMSPEAFRAADRNGDGRLSLEEYVNALFKDFDAADQNKDGVLTHEEIEIYVRATRR
jgi:Ca2+-binding EF-hand superfamily protein